MPRFGPEWWEERGHITRFMGKTTVGAGPSGGTDWEPGVDVLHLRSLLATRWELLRAHGVPTRLQIQMDDLSVRATQGVGVAHRASGGEEEPAEVTAETCALRSRARLSARCASGCHG